MLSEKEKEWLEERTWPVWDYFSCRTCKAMNQFTMRCTFGRCPLMTGYYKDAAEFEARVAAKLAEREHPVPCCSGKSCHPIPYARLCPDCRLKHARLEVEAEMEQN